MITQTITPDTDRGVEFSIDWLTITVHCSVNKALSIYEKVFKQFLGVLQLDNFGFAGYRQSLLALNGFRIFHNLRTGEDRVTFVIPGKACKALFAYQFIDLIAVINSLGYRYNVTRLDLAFDHEIFNPLEVWEKVHEVEGIRTDAKRRTFTLTTSPWEMKDNGSEGTNTVYIGSRSSERMLRIYDKHGYTRVELELKGERASVVAGHLFNADPEDWFDYAMGHLRDFIDIASEWWNEFIGAAERAYMKVTDAMDQSIDSVVKWVDRQVSGSLMVIKEVLGMEVISKLIESARLSSKQKTIIESSRQGGKGQWLTM